MKYVYKVSLIQHRKLVSMFAKGKAKFEYKIGVSITAKHGRIFVFDTLRNARYYAKWKRANVILKCKYRGKQLKTGKILSVFEIEKSFIEFWSNTKKFKCNNVNDWPGSRTVKSLTPIEEVKP